MRNVMEVFYRNRERLLALSESGAKAAYDQLLDIPEIAEMSFNTFKVHFPGFIVLMGLVRVDQSGKREVATVTPPIEDVPKSFEGWTVQTGKDGYIRLYKSFKGHVKSLYVGRGWNPEKAMSKIQQIPNEG